MKAVEYEGGQHLVMGNREPVTPGSSGVRIRVAYGGICGTDLHLVHGAMDHRVTLPHVMGHEMSGVIESVGQEVTRFHPGDHVTVMPLLPCDSCPTCHSGYRHICPNLRFMGIETPGAFQELWTVPESVVYPLPSDLPLRLGALVEPLAVACHDVRRSELQRGEYVVVLGGGPIGALIAMVVRSRGARVLVAEINPYRLSLLKSLGIDVIDPGQTDISESVLADTGGRGADVVFEVTSSTLGAKLMTDLARPRGRIVVVAIFPAPPPVDLHRVFWRELQIRGTRVYEPEDFREAIQIAASSAQPLEKLISEEFPLEQLGEAISHLKGGGGVMKVLIQCDPLAGN